MRSGERGPLHNISLSCTSSPALDGLQATEGRLDSLFDRHPAVVLRPDRYVFGVADEDWNLDRLIHELGRRLSLRSGV